MAKNKNNAAPTTTTKKCPISAANFGSKAKAIRVTINGQEFLASPKEFATGSFGWYLNGKVVVDVDGNPVSVTIGMNAIVVGSKDADR